jgi:hypothetical protein
VPTAFVPQSWRRPVAAIAFWLVVLQSFLSGVATAQAGAALADPLAAAVICHSGGGGSDPAAPSQPDAGAAWHLCCSYCVAAAPALLPPSWQVGRADTVAGSAVLPLSNFIIVVAHEAVRAGPSRAPPGRA